MITLRTFSKAYGLAGIRLGFGIAHPDIIRTLYKVALPFEPSVVALAAGDAALDDHEFVSRYLDMVAKERDKTAFHLRRLGAEVIPSAANFLFVRFKNGEVAERINTGLLKNGIIIRPLTPFGLPEAFRISIGLPEENRRCADAIASVLKE